MEDITDEDTQEMTEELTAIGLRKRRDVNYTVLLQGCGQKTYIDLDIGRYRVTAICNMPIQEWKDRTNRHYVQNCGYVARLSGFEIMQLLEKLDRIVSIRKYQDIGKACAERERQVEKFEKDQRHYWKTVMMQD